MLARNGENCANIKITIGLIFNMERIEGHFKDTHLTILCQTVK